MEDVFLAAVTTDMICELQGRAGFDGFWDSIDADIQEEIEAAVAERVRKSMRIFGVVVK